MPVCKHFGEKKDRASLLHYALTLTRNYAAADELVQVAEYRCLVRKRLAPPASLKQYKKQIKQ